MTKGWYGNRMSHSLASKGIKTKIQPRIDMRKRYLVGWDEYDKYVKSYNPYEYIEFLKYSDMFDRKEISQEEYINHTEKLGKTVKRNNRMVTYFQAGGDNDDDIFALLSVYLDLGMRDKAIEIVKELKRRGFNVDVYKQKYGIDVDE